MYDNKAVADSVKRALTVYGWTVVELFSWVCRKKNNYTD